jgi:subtilase family serine protease
VVSAGGTTVQRDGSGNFTSEKCWSDSGGGVSRYEPRPAYQRIIGNIANARRGTPDWAADADPSSGVAVYSTTYCGGWCRVGGTSASSPILAGIVNQLGTFLNSTSDELTKTYTEYGRPIQYATYFNDIRSGSNGSPAIFGWDQCTGLGTPKNPAGL